MTDGTVKAWGPGFYGTNGDGTYNSFVSPTVLPGLADIADVAQGMRASYALTRTGEVYSWGTNSDGQLGDGTTSNRPTPQLIVGLDDIVAVEGGPNFAAALEADGDVWTWGSNYYGMLGDGTLVDRLTPVRVTLPAPAVAIDIGGIEMHALLADGTLWGWGSNTYGQVGNGSTGASVATPVQITGLPDAVVAIGSTSGTAFAIAGASTVADADDDGVDDDVDNCPNVPNSFRPTVIRTGSATSATPVQPQDLDRRRGRSPRATAEPR